MCPIITGHRVQESLDNISKFCTYPLRGPLAGVQKVGTAGTAGAGQTTFDWTKWDLDGKILDILWQQRRNLVLLWQYYWTHCPIIIGQIVQWHLVHQILANWICPGQCVQDIQNLTYCPMILEHVVQWLLDTFSNYQRIHFLITIGHIVQWLWNTFSND